MQRQIDEKSIYTDDIMHFNNKTFAGVRPHKLGHLSHSAGGWHAYRPINMGKPGGSKHRLEWQLDGAGERECIMMHMLYICVCVCVDKSHMEKLGMGYLPDYPSSVLCGWRYYSELLSNLL